MCFQDRHAESFIELEPSPAVALVHRDMEVPEAAWVHRDGTRDSLMPMQSAEPQTTDI